MMIIIVLVVALVIATSDIHHPDWGAFFAPIREALHIIGTTLRAWWQTLVAWVTATPKAT